MKLHRDLDISHMLHRIREAWAGTDNDNNGRFEGPVEVDETYMGASVQICLTASARNLKALAAAVQDRSGRVKDRTSNEVRAEVEKQRTLLRSKPLS